jgi:hypothetical protein
MLPTPASAAKPTLRSPRPPRPSVKPMPAGRVRAYVIVAVVRHGLLIRQKARNDAPGWNTESGPDCAKQFDAVFHDADILTQRDAKRSIQLQFWAGHVAGTSASTATKLIDAMNHEAANLTQQGARMAFSAPVWGRRLRERCIRCTKSN